MEKRPRNVLQAKGEKQDSGKCINVYYQAAEKGQPCSKLYSSTKYQYQPNVQLQHRSESALNNAALTSEAGAMQLPLSYSKLSRSFRIRVFAVSKHTNIALLFSVFPNFSYNNFETV
jgi:hypothetical protein